MTYLESLVVFEARKLGDEKAAEFFGVSSALIRQWVNGSKRPSLAAVEKVFNAPQGGSEDAAWAGKDVFLCLPCYKTTHPLTMLSILGIWDRQKFGALFQHGDSFIIHTRENLAQRFLATGKEWSLWIDDDTIVPMGNAALYRQHTGFNIPDEFAGLHTANRLLSHGKTIVGGLYFGRHPYGRAMYYDALVDSPAGVEENARAHRAPINELRPTKWTGTGCLLVHRSVFLDVQKANPHLSSMFPNEPFHFFTNASDGLYSRIEKIQQLMTQATMCAELEDSKAALGYLKDANKLVEEGRLDTLQNSHHMQGEDQTFGIRAGKAGHQSYVDLGLVCGHIGTAVYGPSNTSLIDSPQHQHQQKRD